ncbi:hypothetical protein NOU13_30895 [Rhodococcus erythropolis]|uniref:DUF8175 domain-containing protein n=1 Tax=Rhodococcus qingshengii JCM 15477 TaxID=1303681 RepID=A0AB38RM97_RHOSG|nr:MULTISPECIES: hypothetical protein [Rhodococcus]AGT95629.1 hypothetical protein O5Y_29060 [Rhodococcus erythropolis CCM2595]KSU68290.1 hypothetical protein AS032_31360 [Rhodococcus qingshengii]MCQ4128915.1 hypothetical protein [Rhodococcus erythropolis]MDV6212552.1 hypothetical protein [Rhodococcus erythropolis]NDK72954.1 hypothetical protein [Rhodococcus qingshengii]
MSNRTEPRETTEGSRLRRTGEWLATSRTTGIAAAVFCALLAVVVAVAVFIAVTRDDDSAGAGAPTATQPPATAPAKPDSGTAFGVPSADLFGRVIANPVNPRGQALPQSSADRPSFKEGDPVPAPEGLMWQQVGPFILPFSTSDGPTRVDGPLATGFARTPQGAALAAWQISMRTVIDQESLDAVFDNQIEPSTRGNKASWAPKKWIDWSQLPPQYIPAAFKISGWSADNSFAVVEVAARDKTPGSWFTTRFEVVWQDGDWKIRRPSTQLPPQTITSLTGWTQW